MLERGTDDDKNNNADTNSNQKQKHLLEINLLPGGFQAILKAIMSVVYISIRSAST